ncbi:MAG: hypothetical protein M5R36_16575 [Deltaproteobacteria bacterium]|nr:hypothetical protein [Deltaproteobacteria bacterium]
MRAHYPDTEVVVITGYASIEGAVEAVKTGADEYLAKPFTDAGLFDAVARALEKRRGRAGRGRPRRAKASAPAGSSGVGAHARGVRPDRKRPRADANVLIIGESGTEQGTGGARDSLRGKRKGAPFVPINCAGIPRAFWKASFSAT